MNIIFDLDGTIIDSLPGIRSSLVYAMRQQGHVIDEFIDISMLIGPPMNTVVSSLLTPYNDDRVIETVNIYREHYSMHGVYQATLYDGIKMALGELKDKNHRLFIATSKRQRFAEIILTNLKLRSLFTGVIGTQEDGSLDDKSLLLSALIHKHNLNIKNTIMIGDRKDDIISAHKNGVFSIGVLWGYGSSEELSLHNAGIKCRSPLQLNDVIEKSPL
ncbi:HAD hydrolase-like protein [Pectobacterium colocasium]|uniref:HAD hydrolase-like protein n=1 Tax=Pectobacterium colocasium TaxID=2878098 RepID=UPI003B27D676